MEALGILLLAFLFVIYNAFSWGYVASVFYGWFVLPHFPNFPQFGWVEFVGFILFIGVLTSKSYRHIKDEHIDKTTTTVSLFLGPWLTLFLGWLIKVVLLS